MTTETYKQRLSSTIDQHNETIQNNLDTVIYMIGDSSQTPTEDNLLNMLIGIKELHQANTYDLQEKVNRDEHHIIRS